MQYESLTRKKTKIVATIGPATESQEMLEKLMEAGLNVCRLNFSHGDHEEHGARVVNIRAAAAAKNASVAILQDLSGPKIRTGVFYQERVTLTVGDQFTFVTGEEITGNEHKASINYPTLHEEVKPGQMIMVDDGKKKFRVDSIDGREIHCTILVGGETKGKRGVNIPGAYLKVSSLTDKDRADIPFGLKHDVDFMALSFVRRADDVTELRKILTDAGSPNIQIISKIETQEAIDNFDEILEVTDGIMVARGDLAVEVPAERVPLYQKMMVEKAREAGKPVIVATQMLESMINSPVPTRAEVSDVANAIYDGTDAVMLSEETTLGKFPVEAVTMMATIAHTIEQENITLYEVSNEEDSIPDTISMNAVDAADTANAVAIAVPTMSGHSARLLARFRTIQPVVALSPDARVVRQLALSYGCYGFHIDEITTLDGALTQTMQTIKAERFAAPGDMVVITLGMPFGTAGGTNTLMVQKVQ